ncbi:TonB-dependent receptor [Pararobbsia silviterrae]|uniref:TonB-dependent receptor n=1 Tax=Pararobbsia silviterrae TaxID=1792498 RepID=A0A494XIT3_9BURK|nr:TonB-dependent receptor [Pararobbsia silviterrae]RKP49672.1 TonB-dependent receptor [Pararobbsia silviterrae]
MKKRAIARAIGTYAGAEIILSAALLSAAHAQSAPQPADTAANATQADTQTAPVALDKVQVTGSLIRTADKTGYNQVQTITSKDIEQSGATTLSEFLRDSTVNSASSWGDNFAYGATGGAGIAMRGLSEKYTLVLVDGQRVAPYAFPSNGTDSFFDLNTIPLNAIERIEIVKTGAVSQYGSDAIAGVVNIITKKNFQGLEIGGGLGNATSGGEFTKKFNINGGFGDIDADRFNVTASASVFQQNGYTLADRSNTQGQDYTSNPYGLITKGADYWEPNGVGGGGAALTTCPSGGSVVSGASILNGPASGTACGVDTADGMSLHPYEERLSAKIHAAFKIDDTTQAFVDLWGSRNTTVTDEGYASIGDGTEAFNPATGGLTQISNIVPGTNLYNPYHTATPLTYVFTGEPEQLRTTSTFYRASTGVQGSFSTPKFGDWDWTASLSHSQSTVDNYETGLLSVAGLTNIINNSVFDFANPSATPNGLAGLYTSDENEAISKLETLDVSASTSNLFHLPAGDVGFGIGAQFLHESDYVGEYGNQVAGLAIPYSLQSISGERNVAAAYYQLDVPIISGLSFSQSGRYDHYSDFGGAFSPRFALRFQPVRQFTAYASYSRGFRAPTLAENSQSTSSGIQTAIDPYSPTYNPSNPQGQTYSVLVRGNPNLQPERTQNYNLGFELSPDSKTDIGFDWYKIVVKNVIGTANMQELVDENNPNVVVRNANGTIAYVNIGYENLNTLTTDGFEFNFRRALPTTLGTFTLSGDWAWVWHFKQDAGGESSDFAGNDGAIDTPFGASFPRWKGNTNLNWKFDKISATLTYQFTGPYTLTQESGPGRVGSYSQFNLNIAYTGFKHWTIYASAYNLFNRQPPYDPLWQEFPTATPYDPSIYTDEGRYLEVGATYRF